MPAGHKMHLYMCSPNPSHASKDTKYISTCADQTYLFESKDTKCICWTNASNAREDTKCIQTCVVQSHLMSARTQNVSQHVLTELIPCQRGHKINFNMSWANPNHASTDTKCILTWIDQTQPMTAKTPNASQHVLPKPLPCQRRHKIYLNTFWQNLCYASKDTKYVSTCVDQTPFHASKDTKCIGTPVDQTHHIPVRKQTSSQNVLTKPNPCHGRHDIYQNMFIKPLPRHRRHKIYVNLC